MPDFKIDHFELGVPEAEGEAFDRHSWYSEWLLQAGRGEAGITPSHLIIKDHSSRQRPPMALSIHFLPKIYV
ncbi:hypothetical protein [Paenibacillus luteus]|uniref:hypothetical protein n=1 Tax=Paenibacillus luteus TaxID=2545753 RepID=UPI0011427DC6|nr:hypothetical protein [Paenibacillus luteus]